MAGRRKRPAHGGELERAMSRVEIRRGTEVVKDEPQSQPSLQSPEASNGQRPSA